MQVTNGKKIIGGIALGVVLAGATIVGAAQQQDGDVSNNGKVAKHGKHGRHGGGLGRFAGELNLTDAQKEQIQQITARYEQSTAPLRERLRTNRDTGGNASDTFNEAQVRQAAEARAAAHVELEVARERMKSEMLAVLTPEQRTQYGALRQNKGQRRRGWQGQRGLSPSGAR